MKLHALINSRLAAPVSTATPEYLAELAKIDAETGKWVVTYTDTPVAVSADAGLCARVGCDIAPAPVVAGRVLKDTIVQRMKVAGKIPQLLTMVGTLTPADRFEFDQSWWFTSTNPRIVAAITACGADPDTILAADRFAP